MYVKLVVLSFAAQNLAKFACTCNEFAMWDEEASSWLESCLVADLDALIQ